MLLFVQEAINMELKFESISEEKLYWKIVSNYCGELPLGNDTKNTELGAMLRGVDVLEYQRALIGKSGSIEEYLKLKKLDAIVYIVKLVHEDIEEIIKDEDATYVAVCNAFRRQKRNYEECMPDKE